MEEINDKLGNDLKPEVLLPENDLKPENLLPENFKNIKFGMVYTSTPSRKGENPFKELIKDRPYLGKILGFNETDDNVKSTCLKLSKICKFHQLCEILLRHIILDIDGTLVYSTIDDDEIEKIVCRPYLGEFLKFLFDNFDSVSIWTAAGSEYALEVINHIIKKFNLKKKFRFIFSGDQITYEFIVSGKRSYNTRTSDGLGFMDRLVIKDLNEKVFKKFDDMDKYNTMIIDDTKSTFAKNYGNAIHIKKFYPETETEKDNILGKVAAKLKWFKDDKVNFTKWRNRVIHWGDIEGMKFG